MEIRPPSEFALSPINNNQLTINIIIPVGWALPTITQFFIAFRGLIRYHRYEPMNVFSIE